MPCSICGRAEGASTPPCPHCPDYAGGPDHAHRPHTEVSNFALVPTAEPQKEVHDAAIDPEILPPEGQESGRHGARNIFGQTGTGSTQEQGQGQHGSGSFRFAMWHGANSGGNGTSGGIGGMGMGRSSCLPGCITLFLLLVCSVQFGVLAALGFLIFHLVGSGMVLALTLQQMMRGRPAYLWLIPLLGPSLSPVVWPWLGRVVVWGSSWALVGWLSGGF